MADFIDEVAPGEGMDIRERIYHYRIAGESIAEIATRFGIGKARCATLYRQFTTELATVADRGGRASLVQLELDRLDQLQRAQWSMASLGDEKAAKMVLEIMKHRAKLLGLEELPPTDVSVVRSVLVVGNDTASFLASLEQGRKPQLASGDPDNEIEGEVEMEPAWQT